MKTYTLNCNPIHRENITAEGIFQSEIRTKRRAQRSTVLCKQEQKEKEGKRVKSQDMEKRIEI